MDTPKPKAVVGQGVKHRISQSTLRPFIVFLGSATFSISKETVWEITGGFRFGSARGATRLVAGDSLPMELGARFGLLEQFRVFDHQAALLEGLTPFRLDFQRRAGWYAWLSPLRQWFGKNGEARFRLLRASPPVLESRPGVDNSHRSQAVSAVRSWLRRGQCWPSLERWEMCVVFLAILAVARMVIWTTRKKGLDDGANFSHCDPILLFLHQLRVEIRCDTIYPTPPLGQDMTQGQFLSGV